MTKRLLLGTLFLLLLTQSTSQAEPSCFPARATGYSSSQFPGLTLDGTPTQGNEWTIMAAARRYPMGRYYQIVGLGTFRVADRGMLDEHGIDFDILVRTVEEAYAVTGWYEVCPPP